ncbi:hypothetical protein J6590_024544 [Homalodisca vitripennis]|nr:hypothetical protein J6590_024544 [Homalodisca vitripennis]
MKNGRAFLFVDVLPKLLLEYSGSQIPKHPSQAGDDSQTGDDGDPSPILCFDSVYGNITTVFISNCILEASTRIEQRVV